MVGSSDFPRYSQDVGATVSVLCDSRTVLCSVSIVRLFSILRQTTRLVLVVLQTNLGRHPCEGMLCVRQLQLKCGPTLNRCFCRGCRGSSQAASFSGTVSTVLVYALLTSIVVRQD